MLSLTLDLIEDAQASYRTLAAAVNRKDAGEIAAAQRRYAASKSKLDSALGLEVPPEWMLPVNADRCATRPITSL